MAVAPRPWQVAALPEVPRRRKSVQRGAKSVKSVVRLAPRQAPTHASKATTVPAPQPKTKANLKLLAMGQRFTQFLAIATVGTAVGLYACTVYNQKAWGDAYSQLDQLRDDEQSYVTNNESLKQQFREQSEEPSAALAMPKPEHNVFVPEPPAVTLRPQAEPSLQPINSQGPIGY